MKEIDLIDMPEHEIKFNPLNHVLVPHHVLVPADKEEEELPDMTELVSDKEKVDDETFEDVDWE